MEPEICTDCAICEEQVAKLRRDLAATEQALLDMTEAWKGACASGDEARAELERMRPIATAAGYEPRTGGA